MKQTRIRLGAGAVALLSAACTSHTPRSLGTDPVALAAVRADVRLVDGQTTWVAHGTGYELVGRSKADIAALQSQLDREAAVVRRVFPADSLARVVIKVRRASAEGQPFVAAAPIPTTTRGAVVEVVLANPKAKKDKEKDKAPANAGGQGLLAERTPTLPVMRAWLSAHATSVTHTPARITQASGEVEDARVPAWAEEMIPSLAVDSVVDRFTVALATHSEDLIPLTRYFTMERPADVVPAVAQRGGNGGGNGGNGGGGGGSSGGMGGMGGGRGGRGGGGRGGGGGGMGGRGGGMGGGGSRSQGDKPAAPLQGGALFDMQSVVFGQYLAHESYDLIGALVDAQLAGKSVDDVFTARNSMSLTQMDVEWHRWLSDRAGTLLMR
ncbi:MAG: hypothetical protein JWM41_2814 [Gemmatimonadetes bacterium]|nr:hypothetical protein [Gemmatimonadota bacterium]